MSKSVSGKAFDLDLLKRVLKYVNPYMGTFILTGILTLVLAILGPIRPYLIQYTVDNHIAHGNLAGLRDITILMVVLLFIEGYIQFYQTYIANKVGQSVIKDLRVQVYDKIIGFKLKYFDNTAIGTLVTRIISDIETIADIFSQGVLIILGDILKLIVVIAFMSYTDWRLTLLSLIPIPLLLIATNIFKNYIKRAFQDVRNAVAKLNAFVQEHITGMNIVQVFSREQQEYEAFKTINKDHTSAHIKTVWANSIFFPVVEILSAASIAILVWWGAKEVIAEHSTLGNLMAFILYIYMLYRPIRQLADRFNILQMGMVSSERVFKILDTDEEIVQDADLKPAEIKGEIKFNDVWFAYKEDNYVLKGISFHAQSGETVAFVGATGAGKTSVVNLLSRLYEFQKGTIELDTVSVRDFNLDYLRINVGVVLQDVFLFSDSILNNITLNNPAISKEQVIEAAKIVGAHEFISKLPNGYDYHVGERGGMLSVGQRQLLAFIRAYVYNPKVLVLDEATSSVDSETEALIQNAIDVLTKGRTSIIIAHRLATIRNAQNIIVLDKGQVMEQGDHNTLLEQNGFYKNLFEKQFGEESE